MADAYLNIAEQVLDRARTPLRAGEILKRAFVGGLIPSHLHGLRQDRTLQARLSEDISRNPDRSRFFRTGPATFFLQALRSDPTLPEQYRRVYLAPPRRRSLRKDPRLRAVIQDAGPRIMQAAMLPVRAVIAALKPNAAIRTGARGRSDALVRSFVVVFRNGELLTYRSGRFRADTDSIEGRRSIGIGGTVFTTDADLLFDSMFGVIASGINELGYGLGLPRRLAEVARYENQLRPLVGVVSPPPAGSSEPVLHVVLKYDCPYDFEPTRVALSVNDLRWISLSQRPNDLSDFDEVSRILIEHGLPRLATG